MCPEAVGDLLARAREAGVERRPFVWVEKLVPLCRPEVDLANRRRGQDLLGQVLRIVEELRDDPESAENGCEAAWGELYGHGTAQRDLVRPTGAEAEALLGDAELLCLDLLEAPE